VIQVSLARFAFYKSHSCKKLIFALVSEQKQEKEAKRVEFEAKICKNFLEKKGKHLTWS
jgi:hypothetical protein